MGTAFEDLCGIPGSLGGWWPVALLIDFSIGNVDVATSQPRTPLVGRAPLIGFNMEDDRVVFSSPGISFVLPALPSPAKEEKGSAYPI